MQAVNRADLAPRLSLAATVGAWWAEVRVASRVFLWRQPFRWRAWPDVTVPLASGVCAAVLLHGFVCNRGLWQPCMRELRHRGLPYTSVRHARSLSAGTPMPTTSYSRPSPPHWPVRTAATWMACRMWPWRFTPR